MVVQKYTFAKLMNSQSFSSCQFVKDWILKDPIHAELQVFLFMRNRVKTYLKLDSAC